MVRFSRANLIERRGSTFSDVASGIGMVQIDAMWIARVPTVLALVLWGLLTFSGAFGMAEIAEQGAPGYPNAAQVVTYVLIPLLMTGLCIFLTAAAGREERAMTVGCLGGVALLALLPWAFVASGGI